MFPFFWSYDDQPHVPYWGAPNSHANFCEEDYILTSYCAEFINTLTNLTYLSFAYYGIKSNSNQPDAWLRNFAYLGIAAVGIGSAVFHSTLKNYTQWCDELSMHIATATVLHRVYTYDKSSSYAIKFGLVTTFLLSAFIVYHCATDELLLHSIVFGIMVVFVAEKTRAIIRMRVHNEAIQREIKKIADLGTLSSGLGFTLWGADQLFCSQLTAMKRAIGMPLSFLLEFHGWWHFFTGVGAYAFIALAEYATSEGAGKPLGDKFAWPVSLIIDGNAGSKSSNDLRRAAKTEKEN